MKNIAIIGAGSSGLFLSKKLSDLDAQVYVFEKCKNVGTKLRASGGGKANIFNTHITPGCYNNPDFAQHLLVQVTPEILKKEFENMGLAMTADEEGRVYPTSQYSQTIIDILWEPDRPNLHPELEYEVKRVWAENGKWHIDDYPVLFDNVVFATGTPANMIPKNKMGYNAFLRYFNFKFSDFQPSLVGFKIKNYPKQLSGCRVKVIASLYCHEKLVHQESGEVTFKDDGISGIVILNLSAYYHRLPEKDSCYVELNFMYDNPDYDVNQHFKRFGTLKGILHPKLNALYEKFPFDVKKYKLEIDSLYDLAFAQVCHGGVDISEVDEHFALKRYPGAYMTGELLDIDGICGGYNLFFAFASALVVARKISN